MTTEPLAPAGWYPDPSGARRQRYFDGSQWTEHYTYPLSLEERSERLDMAILSGGREAAVESRSPTQAVLLTSRGMSGAAHVVFALLSIFTCGLFLIPWAIMAATQHDQRAVVTVDLYGNVTWSF